MKFHGDLSRHLIRTYLDEFVGKSMDIWIWGIWIYGYLMNPLFFECFPSNSVDLSSNFLAEASLPKKFISGSAESTFQE